MAAPHGNDRTSDRRLRIGYVSAHFREHAVSFFSLPLLAAHDHAEFEIFCYSNSAADDSDAITAEFQQAADCWRTVAGLSDEALADLVREDQIDILVDLAGHIGGNRLLAFARKPAPIQVTYLGYQNTTGMSAMDYRLTDVHADPPGMIGRFLFRKTGAAAAKLFLLLAAAGGTRSQRAAGDDFRTRHVGLVQLHRQDHARGHRYLGEDSRLRYPPLDCWCWAIAGVFSKSEFTTP